MRLYSLTDAIHTIHLCTTCTLRHLTTLKGIGLGLPTVRQTTLPPSNCLFCKFG